MLGFFFSFSMNQINDLTIQLIVGEFGAKLYCLCKMHLISENSLTTK